MSTHDQKQISPAELAPGIFITVLRWLPREMESAGMMGVQTLTHVDHSFEGDVLEVKAVQLPFVAVADCKGCLRHTFELDTRRCVLMELNRDYILALHPELIAKLPTP